ncbi:hypothetical protein EYF80_058054 [Liparis tanakae]|uniref:Uncharacterized protein n=1 Tax=Liparis tanakae TaxID=230148 RepID=A0A4Z2ESK5_9TELE|nr:hypothetical protein EYF80_058054 [Liparis tanakae]
MSVSGLFTTLWLLSRHRYLWNVSHAPSPATPWNMSISLTRGISTTWEEEEEEEDEKRRRGRGEGDGLVVSALHRVVTVAGGARRVEDGTLHPDAAVRPLAQAVVAPPAAVAALPLHVGFAAALTRDQPGGRVGVRVAQAALQRAGRVAATRCGEPGKTIVTEQKETRHEGSRPPGVRGQRSEVTHVRRRWGP